MNCYGIKRSGKKWLVIRYLPPKTTDYSSGRFARRAKTISKHDSMEAARTEAQNRAANIQERKPT